MSEFKGTKGKWEFYPISEESNGYISVEIPMGSILVYNGIYPYTFSEDKEKSIEILEANAKLIACAPDMLEMLKIMGDALLELMNHQDGWEDDYENLKQLIKKATGL